MKLTQLSKVTSYKRGFTLVEIMIVVAIIGIIIAIAVPAFIRARETSRARACQENLSKIDGAVEQYAMENNIANGTSVSLSDLHNTGGTGYLKSEPECPGGGTYSSSIDVGDAPSCDYTEPDWIGDELQHELPGAPAAAAATTT